MKTERSDVKFPLWRKKVDSSLFHKLETPIPNWLAKVWDIKITFGENTSKMNPIAKVQIQFDKEKYEGWVQKVQYQRKDTTYKLSISKEFGEKLKDVFVMSFMRSLEQKLRKNGEKHEYTENIEDEIPFWEFLDIEFDKKTNIFKCKNHYFQKPIFPELFKQFIKSHLLKDIENKLLNKGDFKFIKEDWQPKTNLKKMLERKNIIYYLIDIENKFLYIGEAESTKRISQIRKEIPDWNYFRIDCLPEWLSRNQRLELERLIIRSFAALINNNKNILSKSISQYTLINKKIDN